MQYNNFHYAMVLANQMYGVNMQSDDFEELGLIKFNKIGNKRCKLKKVILTVGQDGITELPCDCDQIEAITYGFEDAMYNSPIYQEGDFASIATEHYIEARKLSRDPYYQSGRYVKYRIVDDQHIQITEAPKGTKVLLLYKQYIMDNEGLPMITDDEALAIATYVASIDYLKRGLKTNNQALITLSKELERKTAIYTDQARIPEYLSQNELNEILDASVSHDRKLYNKSFKPLK